MNADGVAIGIKDHRHSAYRRGEWLDSKFDIVLLQMSHGSVEVFHFERGTTAVRIGFESRCTTEGQRVRTKFIFGPLTVLVIGHGG